MNSSRGGRNSLFVGHPGDTMCRFENTTPGENRPLIEFLYLH